MNNQAKRRKTLFPLSPKQINHHRAILAYHLVVNCGLPIYGARQVLKCSPDTIRNLVAKAKRIKRDFNLCSS